VLKTVKDDKGKTAVNRLREQVSDTIGLYDAEDAVRRIPGDIDSEKLFRLRRQKVLDVEDFDIDPSHD
ncbi:unnamed protein product, partial [marine sediment metagenome]